MASVQQARGSNTSREIFCGIKERLTTGLTTTGGTTPPPDGFVRPIAFPDDLSTYKAEEGIAFAIGDPEPFVPSGAGRSGYLLKRELLIFVATQSLEDQAGVDEIAIEKHLDLEDSVVNSLLDTPPATSDYNNRVGIRVKWIPGGNEIRRQMKVDPGMLLSVFLFDVQYAAPTQVYRD